MHSYNFKGEDFFMSVLKWWGWNKQCRQSFSVPQCHPSDKVQKHAIAELRTPAVLPVAWFK
jgi:hypothetical protein